MGIRILIQDSVIDGVIDIEADDLMISVHGSSTHELAVFDGTLAKVFIQANDGRQGQIREFSELLVFRLKESDNLGMLLFGAWRQGLLIEAGPHIANETERAAMVEAISDAIEEGQLECYLLSVGFIHYGIDFIDESIDAVIQLGCVSSAHDTASLELTLQDLHAGSDESAFTL